MTDFFKYHGLGNDFVIVEGDGRDADRDWIRRVCDRHRGVGADGVLFVGPPQTPASDGTMILHNQDGSRPEMCGNGIRCAVRHLVEQGDLAPTDEIAIDTDAGPKTCRVESDQPGSWRVAVDMGRPEFRRDSIERTVDGRTRTFRGVDVGNPHAVTFGVSPDTVVDQFGRAMNDGDPAFPDGVNVEFVDVLDETSAEVVVFERGVGRTQACGTGACAAAVAGWRTGRLDETSTADMRLPGGSLRMTEDERHHVWMSGPVEAVFFGEFTSDWN